MTNIPYTGAFKRVVTLSLPLDKINQWVPISDQVGAQTMLLTTEQYWFIRNLNSYTGNKILVDMGVLSTLTSGKIRYKPFVFAKQTVVLTYQKGNYGRLLSIGTDPSDSEAYDLLTATCNPSILPHCMMQGNGVVIPLIQPPTLVNGSKNYWSVKLEYVI